MVAIGLAFVVLSQAPFIIKRSTAYVLKPPPGSKLILDLHAKGDQIYISDGQKWVLSHPEAKLYDDKRQVVGRHFAGPTWEYKDHSQVVGKMILDGGPNARGIPWLLLKAKDHKRTGEMQIVQYIQRLNTKGGKPPRKVGPKGKEVREHYSADYLFFALPLRPKHGGIDADIDGDRIFLSGTGDDENAADAHFYPLNRLVDPSTEQVVKSTGAGWLLKFPKSSRAPKGLHRLHGIVEVDDSHQRAYLVDIELATHRSTR